MERRVGIAGFDGEQPNGASCEAMRVDLCSFHVLCTTAWSMVSNGSLTSSAGDKAALLRLRLDA